MPAGNRAESLSPVDHALTIWQDRLLGGDRLAVRADKRSVVS
jgi:hypothetical protein